MKYILFSLCLVIFLVDQTVARKPNVLVLMADDLGYGDVGCYGNTTIKTPNIDNLAKEGVQMTHHIAAAPMCTPSRGAMITGRLPVRYGLTGTYRAPPVILYVASSANLPEEEITLGEAFKAAGYKTGYIGKWHLGSGCGLFGKDCNGPLDHGFDTFYGISLTLLVEFAKNPQFLQFPLHDRFNQGLLVSILITLGTAAHLHRKGKHGSAIKLFIGSIFIIFLGWLTYTHLFNTYPFLVGPYLNKNTNSILMNENKIEERPINLEGLSQRFAQKSVEFMKENKDEPFLLFHGFPHVHTPMFIAKHNDGRSKHGRFGDNIEELDESLGTILKGLDDLGLTDDTIVYFVSDQGGHLEAIDDDGQRIGGHNGKFKGGKFQGGAEGAVRVPGIIKWPNHLPTGKKMSTPTSMMDMLPTLLSLSGQKPLKELFPQSNELDGVDITPLLMEGDSLKKNYNNRVFLHYCSDNLHALRLLKGNRIYKMHIYKNKYQPGSTQCGWGSIIGCMCHADAVYDLREQPHLYELTSDPYEDSPIDSNTQIYKDIVEEMTGHLNTWRAKEKTFPPSQLRHWRSFWNPLLQPWN